LRNRTTNAILEQNERGVKKKNHPSLPGDFSIVGELAPWLSILGELAPRLTILGELVSWLTIVGELAP
jgi:hypothetical protein